MWGLCSRSFGDWKIRRHWKFWCFQNSTTTQRNKWKHARLRGKGFSFHLSKKMIKFANCWSCPTKIETYSLWNIHNIKTWCYSDRIFTLFIFLFKWFPLSYTQPTVDSFDQIICHILVMLYPPNRVSSNIMLTLPWNNFILSCMHWTINSISMFFLFRWIMFSVTRCSTLTCRETALTKIFENNMACGIRSCMRNSK